MSHRPAIRLLLCVLLLPAVLHPAGQTVSGSPPKAAGAAKSAAPAQKTGEKTDACALLTRAEIQVVQSEPVEETKPSTQPSGGFVMLQCFYRTTTFAKSVSLAMATPDPAKPSALTPREFWRKQFHPPEPMEKTEVEREEELRKPRPIDRLGEEAYWVGNPITGALYVLNGEVFLRISVGGAREESARMEKSKALAHAALKRL